MTDGHDPEAGRTVHQDLDAACALSPSATLWLDDMGLVQGGNERGWVAVPAAIRGSRFVDCVHEPDRPIAIQQGMDLLAPRSSHSTVSLRIGEKDPRWYDVRARSVDVGAHSKYFVLELESCDARRRTEELLRITYHESPIGYAEFDLAGRLVEANSTYLEMRGLDVGDVGRDDFGEQLRPEAFERVTSAIVTLIEGARSVTVEVPLERADGAAQLMRLRLSLVRDEGGVPTRVRSEMTDISDTALSAELRRDFFDRAPVGFVEFGPDGTPVSVNPRGRALLGDRPPLDAVRPGDHDRLIELVTGGAPGDSVTLPSANVGACSWFRWSVHVHRDHNDQVVCSVVDVSDEVERAENYRTLFEYAPMAYAEIDHEESILRVNRRWCTLFGREADEMIGRRNVDRVHPDDMAQLVAATLANDMTEPTELRLVSDTGTTRAVRMTMSRLRDTTGAPTGWLVGVEDRTEEVAREELNAQLGQVVEVTSDVVGLVDREPWTFTYLNPTGIEFFGSAEGANAAMRSATDVAGAEMRVRIGQALEASGSWSGELRFRLVDEPVVLQTEFRAVRSKHGDGSVAFVARDVTRERAESAALEWRASHDPLTGLSNRSAMEDHLDGRHGEDSPAVIFIDLDRLKAINDRLGHEAGDLLLRQVGGRIASVLRSGTEVFRLGGDEFVIVARSGSHVDSAAAIARRVAETVEARPFDLGAEVVSITLSIGVVVAHDGAGPEQLLREADQAMYRAKSMGRARIEFYDQHNPAFFDLPGRERRIDTTP